MVTGYENVEVHDASISLRSAQRGQGESK
jgi:hypothetical protein